jgi:hypothetical protein
MAGASADTTPATTAFTGTAASGANTPPAASDARQKAAASWPFALAIAAQRSLR